MADYSTANESRHPARPLVRKYDLEDRAYIVFSLKDIQAKDFCIAAVFAGDKGVAIGLYLQETRNTRAGHGQVFDMAPAMQAF